MDALPHSPSPNTTRSAAVFPPEFGSLVASSFHTVSSLVTYLGSFAVVHWCCRKPYVTLYRPKSSGVTPSTSVEPPWSTASHFRWLRCGEKGFTRFARVWGSRWCPWFGQRPHRRREIVGECHLGHEDDDPDTRDPLLVTHHFPPFLLFKSRFLAFLQKLYLQFLRSKNCEINFVMFLLMASF